MPTFDHISLPEQTVTWKIRLNFLHSDDWKKILGVNFNRTKFKAKTRFLETKAKLETAGSQATWEKRNNGESISLAFPVSGGCPHALAHGCLPSSKSAITSLWPLLSLPHLLLSHCPASLSYIKGPLWLCWACPNRPGESPHLKAGWLATSILSATLIPDSYRTQLTSSGD